MDKTAFLIPVRGKTSSMQRLRQDLSNHMVDKIVEFNLKRTTDLIDKHDIPTILVTADKELKVPHNVNIVYDDASSLNSALSLVVETLEYSRYILIMPDLPGLTNDILKKFLHLSDLHQNVLFPTQDNGTGMVSLPSNLFTRSLLGKESAQRINRICKKENIPLAEFIVQDSNRDLDDIDDWNYWKENGFKLNQM